MGPRSSLCGDCRGGRREWHRRGGAATRAGRRRLSASRWSPARSRSRRGEPARRLSVAQLAVHAAARRRLGRGDSVKEDTLVVHEIYVSIQGESTLAGLPCAFVRLTGCNLRCTWCDTRAGLLRRHAHTPERRARARGRAGDAAHRAHGGRATPPAGRDPATR